MAKRKQKTTYTVGFIALGCPKNIVDAEKMLAHIGSEGFILTNNTDNADVIVVNTCGFIEPAKIEAIDAIKDAVKLKKKGSVKKVIVAGCLAQRMGDDLRKEVRGIDAIVRIDQRDNIAQIIKDTIAHKKQPERPDTEPSLVHDDQGRLLITPNHWAYLRISEGCSRKCSFCTIPAIRGAFRSKPLEAIVAEARELAQNGAAELSVIAQDSSNYGKDIGLKDGLVTLIKELEKIDELKWIRLMYLYPANISDELIEAIAQSEKVLNYIDMPIQHISNAILKSMKRIDTKEKTTALIEKLRAAIPNVVLRTTVIVGYPGETDENFAELLEFVKWARFDALGCFPYYPEIGTDAATLEGQLTDKVKNQRIDELMLAQQQIAFEKAVKLKGAQLTCLVDEIFDDGDGIGRYFGQAPHIDSVCFIENCSKEPGEFALVTVTGSKDYDLICQPLL